MASYLTLPKFALGIDWETSGYSLPDYAREHQGISFGAIVFDVRKLEPVEELYREIKFNPRYRWEAGAERVHGLSQAHLEQGVEQAEAAAGFCNLIIKYFGTDAIMLLGHRVHFDLAFTKQLTESIDVSLEYHPTTIDTASIATILMEMSKSEDIFQTLGMPPRRQHNALEDIRNTLESVRRMKELFLKGVISEL